MFVTVTIPSLSLNLQVTVTSPNWNVKICEPYRVFKYTERGSFFSTSMIFAYERKNVRGGVFVLIWTCTHLPDWCGIHRFGWWHVHWTPPPVWCPIESSSALWPNRGQQWQPMLPPPSPNRAIPLRRWRLVAVHLLQYSGQLSPRHRAPLAYQMFDFRLRWIWIDCLWNFSDYV